MVHYLIEFRFSGYGKKYAKSLIYEVARKFRVRGVTQKRAVPHISLYGPFQTRNQRAMVSTVVRVAKKYSLIPFTIKGFNYFDNKTNKVIYLDVKPSNQLEKLRYELSKALRRTTTTKSVHDHKKKFYFHSTIAFKDIDKKFERIWGYLQSKEEPNIKQHLLRVTILKGKKILYEYDLIQGRLLNRRQARDRRTWKRTIEMFKDMKDNFVEEIEGEHTLWQRLKSILN